MENRASGMESQKIKSELLDTWVLHLENIWVINLENKSYLAYYFYEAGETDHTG